MRKLLLSALTAAALALVPQSAAQAAKEEVVLGLSQDRVAITATFDGSEILIFGAVKRETPIPTDEPLEVIVAVSGPAPSVMVRRKEKKLGIWVNSEAVEIDNAPSFYAVSSTRPLKDIISTAEDLRVAISVPHAIRAISARLFEPNAAEFIEALIRIREDEGLYRTLPGAIELTEDTLFRGRVALPANLTEGDYVTRIFLMRNNQIIDAYETTIDVRKVGLERWIYNLAHQKPLIYGLLSLAIAIVAGWGASAFFRLLKN